MFKIIFLISIPIALIANSVFAAKEANVVDLFGKLTSMSQYAVFKSLPNYNEAPALKKLVSQGKLPPVEERLPPKPFVYSTTVMVDGIGEYGGIHRRVSGSATNGWNGSVGNVAGWGGMMRWKTEPLVKTATMRMINAPEPAPNLATSWSWSNQGKTLTMNLIKGVKWSDGECCFDADDVLFTYYDNWLDKEIPGFGQGTTFNYGTGIDTVLKKIDSHTIEWQFPVAYPRQFWFTLGKHLWSPIAEHVYKKHHPKYSNNSYDKYINFHDPQKLPDVVLGPYIPVKYKTDQMAAYVRNPFYWKVDEEGNQLPYWDEVPFAKASSWAGRTLNVLAGTSDITLVNDPDLYSLVIAATNNPNSHVSRFMGGYVKPLHINFNYSLKKGVKNKKTATLRKIFRQKEFRIAISHLVNRKGITQGLFPVPGAIKEYYGGYPEGSAMYDESKVVKYKYSIDKAKNLLDGLGLKDTDGDGILNYPASSGFQNENFIIEIITVSTEDERVKIAEALVNDFKKAGIDLKVKYMQGGLYTSRINAGEWDLSVERMMDISVPEGASGLFPITHGLESPNKRVLLPFEKEMMRLVDSSIGVDGKKLKEIYGEILKIHTENQYWVGVYQMKWILTHAKRHRNVPNDFPGYLYDWCESALPAEIRWTPKDLQLQSQFENLIPTPELYQTQTWNAKN